MSNFLSKKSLPYAAVTFIIFTIFAFSTSTDYELTFIGGGAGIAAMSIMTILILYIGDGRKDYEVVSLIIAKATVVITVILCAVVVEHIGTVELKHIVLFTLSGLWLLRATWSAGN